MKRAIALFLLLFRVSLADTERGPAHPPVTLEHLLQIQKECWSPAWVSSGFYDWRTVSKYRRRAGLHLGYDIAMPYGAPVAAAWPGRVVAVTPWTSTEWGITVLSPQGWTVTYGHLKPGVQVGQELKPGSLLGSIASDHVDVKMRDPKGQYVAFGQRPPKVSPPDPKRLRRLWEQGRKRCQALQDKVLELQAMLRPSGRKRSLKKARELQALGLLSRREFEEQQSLHETQDQLEERLLRTQSELAKERSKLEQLEPKLRELGLALETPKAPTVASSPSENPSLNTLLKRGDISQREWREAQAKIGNPLPLPGVSPDTAHHPKTR